MQIRANYLVIYQFHLPMENSAAKLTLSKLMNQSQELRMVAFVELVVTSNTLCQSIYKIIQYFIATMESGTQLCLIFAKEVLENFNLLK